MENELIHYGTPKHSGRYPYGSHSNTKNSAEEYKRKEIINSDKKWDKRIEKKEKKISKISDTKTKRYEKLEKKINTLKNNKVLEKAAINSYTPKDVSKEKRTIIAGGIVHSLTMIGSCVLYCTGLGPMLLYTTDPVSRGVETGRINYSKKTLSEKDLKRYKEGKLITNK